MTVKGVRLEWEELPFEWLRPWRFGVLRRYSRGPLVEMRVLTVLEPVGGDATRLTYDVVAVPRGLFGLITTPIQIGFINRITFGRTFRRYADEARRREALRASAPPPAPLRAARARRAYERMNAEGVEASLASALATHLDTADDLTLARIRPYVLAGLWGLDRRDVLVACLRATRAGVLNLTWDVLCPSCLGAKQRADTLRALRLGSVHCDTCQVDFTTDFDSSVELAFHPNPGLRQVVGSPFCVAGPQVTPHVEVQQLLAPGASRSVAPVLTTGRHRLRRLGAAGGPTFLVAEGGARSATVRVHEAGWEGAPSTLAPDASLSFDNACGREVLVCVERLSWADTAVTAAEVTALREFRDLFSTEILADGAFASVGSLAVLFTDLRGSTALYRRVGDALAFAQVRGHFGVLSEAVAGEKGAVVKTIGDAVMAVFPTSVQAVRATLRAHDELARHVSGGEAMVLKAGIHFGPAIAVTFNERLDYFGSTVNLAARFGALSRGDDMVLSEGVRSDPDVARALEDAGLEAEPFEAEVRGFEGRLTVWRVEAPRGSAITAR
jgi:class 3 adenylate cyclase